MTPAREARTVRAYLEIIAQPPARHPSNDTLRRKLERVEQELDGAPPIRRLMLIQRRIDLTAQLEAPRPVDRDELEAQFVAVAANYAERHRISRQAFRALGVKPSVLRAAGIA